VAGGGGDVSLRALRAMAVLQSGPALSLSKRTHAVLGLAPSAVCVCMCVRLCVGFVHTCVCAMCVLGRVWARECYHKRVFSPCHQESVFKRVFSQESLLTMSSRESCHHVIKRESCHHVIKTGACYSMTGLTCVCVVSDVCVCLCLTRVLLNPCRMRL